MKNHRLLLFFSFRHITFVPVTGGLAANRHSGLKGNRVKIPDSPAAVFSVKTYQQTLKPLTVKAEPTIGKAIDTGISQKTCLYEQAVSRFEG